EILKKIWKHLDLGTLEREHPFHTPVFATVANGCAPDLRVVVLRRFWRKPPLLAFHAHVGSPKVKQIENNPNVYYLFYHPTERIQVRVKGRAIIHTDDDLAEEQWLATEFFSRRCYVGEAPGTVSKKPASGLPEDLLDRAPTAEESEAGRANFVVVSSTIEQIDCLELNVRGHRRSLFIWNETGNIESRWLTP
ncbi:MAG TPA: pyridoxamine 5'-phosphate oxidase family protein, partial [Pyrinomonadaceae bacterium]|nr:pyridoxamine 5'-phosphate oxidase family protein [Pyrinomonadaceae bacterium]